MIIACDASQLEWRTVLELSGDPVGLAEVVEGQDTHSLNQEFFNLPSRLIAKIYLFRTIFNRGAGYAFTVDPQFMHVSTSVDFWNEVGVKFYTKYKKIDELYDKNLTLIGQGKPIVGPLGRWWKIPMTAKGDLPVTKAVNYPTQGTGADVMMLARLMAKARISKQSWGHLVAWVSTVHDSIVVDAPGEYVQPIAQIFDEVFADLPKVILKNFDYVWTVPLACETKFGMNMKDMQKVA